MKRSYNKQNNSSTSRLPDKLMLLQQASFDGYDSRRYFRLPVRDRQ
ncbi:hypothetical protein [Paenibacillus sp. N3.4]|nr:hypothetical protein [Paenibacillus sp. N3.4]